LSNKNLQLLLEALKQYHIPAEIIDDFENRVTISETVEEEILQMIKSIRLQIKEDLDCND